MAARFFHNGMLFKKGVGVVIAVDRVIQNATIEQVTNWNDSFGNPHHTITVKPEVPKVPDSRFSFTTSDPYFEQRVFKNSKAADDFFSPDFETGDEVYFIDNESGEPEVKHGIITVAKTKRRFVLHKDGRKEIYLPVSIKFDDGSELKDISYNSQDNLIFKTLETATAEMIRFMITTLATNIANRAVFTKQKHEEGIPLDEIFDKNSERQDFVEIINKYFESGNIDCLYADFCYMLTKDFRENVMGGE